ncbi:hypothetical protein ACJMK2_009353 [Sinanodonta woodiana]|uniref:RNA helicase n=1 Tax=Sinanodonta woodiana TaxID=1069815 RepID=A0ABD3VD73_SINWO
MEGRIFNIAVVKISDPSHFVACIITNDEDFKKLCEDMNSHFGNSQVVSTIIERPRGNEICAAKDGRNWHRVKVEEIVQGGTKVSCFFLDIGKTEILGREVLRQLPGKFQTVLYQVRNFCLHGVKALTMTIVGEDLMHELRPSRKWDSSVVTFMRKKLDESLQSTAEVVREDGNGTLHVILKLKMPGGSVLNLNEELIRKKYAVNAAADEEVSLGRSSRLMIHSDSSGLRGSFGSGDRPVLQKDFLQHVSRNRDCFSDTEGIDRHSAYFQGNSLEISKPSLDHGYMTDTAPKIRIHHRGHFRKEGGNIPEQAQVSPTGGQEKNLVMGPLQAILGGSGPVPLSCVAKKMQRNEQNVYHKLPREGADERIVSTNSSQLTNEHKSSNKLTEYQSTVSISSLSLSSASLVNLQNSLSSASSSSSHSSLSCFDSVQSKRPQISTGSSLLNGILSAMKSYQTKIHGKTPQLAQNPQILLPACGNASSSTANSSENSQGRQTQPALVGVASGCSLRSLSGKQLLIKPVVPKISGSDVRTKSDTEGSKLTSKQVNKSQLHPLPYEVGDLVEQKTKLVKLTAGMFQVEDNVLVHGVLPQPPYRDFTDAPFTEFVKTRLERFNFASPTLVQAYTWPPICRGRHVIAVSPVNTGKTIAYLAPMVSYVMKIDLYESLPKENGPYIIILVPSWKKAEEVYLDLQCMTLTSTPGEGHVPNIALLYGGGNEENQAIKLINGCEILVATPACLLRMVEKGFTDLNKLCHLVIDNADSLLEIYTEELKEIMKKYAFLLNERSDSSKAPRQFLLFSSQWNQAIESFMSAYLEEPLIIMTSMFEAAIYGKVKQVVHMCKTDQQSQQVLALMETIPMDQNKIIIFSSKKSSITYLKQLLSHQCKYNLLVYPEMSLEDIELVREEWISSNPVLICHDELVSELWVSNANVVIHYDLPDSKTKFGNRLSCMRQYFFDYSSETERSKEPTSHILITEECGMQMQSLDQLLRRSRCNIPIQMKAMLAGIHQVKEEDRNKGLCVQLKAFGLCRLMLHCGYRHLLIPEVDCPAYSNWLPNEGELKVHILYVVNANHYFVRILEHRTTQNSNLVTTNLSAAFGRLQWEMSFYYAKQANWKQEVEPDTGNLYSYMSEEESFFRVRVIGPTEIDETCRAVSLVQFIDIGKEARVPADKLFYMPTHLKDIPPQAVEVFVCRIQPVDKDTEWTSKADNYISKAVGNQTLEGNIVLRIGNTVWFDPLVQQMVLQESGSITNHFIIHLELLRNGLAIENPKHLDLLYKLCKGRIDVPKSLLQKSSLGILTSLVSTDILPECDDYFDVYVPQVDTPDLIFVQRKQTSQRLETQMDELNEFFSKKMKEISRPKYAPGVFCVAQFSKDNRWHRGKILSLIGNDKCEVFFTDYGDKETVPTTKIYELPKDFQELPFQAIECRLAHITPWGDKWEEAAGDILWNLTHFVGGDMKLLVAKVMGKEASDYAGLHRYIVELSEMSQVSINLAQALVWQKVAKPMPSSPLEELFPILPAMSRKIYSSRFDKIPDLCAAIYWEKEDEAKAQQMCMELSVILSAVPTGVMKSSSLMAEIISSLCKLVGHVRNATLLAVILDRCILGLAEADIWFQDEILKEDVITMMTLCLEQNSDPEIQRVAAASIARFSNSVKKFQQQFQEKWRVSTLKELLESTENTHVQSAVCQALASICQGSDRLCDEMLTSQLCVTVGRILANDNSVAESCLDFLSVLASYDSSHPELKKESLIEDIVKTLGKSTSDKCIRIAITFCKNFAAVRRKNKTFLLEKEIVPILSRILQQRQLSSTTTQLCEDLHRSLVVRIPQEPMSSSAVIPEHSGDQQKYNQSRIFPEVRWSQNSFAVLLSVKVNGVKGNPVIMDEKSVHFKATIDGRCYSFDYDLYDRIIPNKSRMVTHQREVLISLKKLEKGRWPRLVRGKKKPVNLTIDFERFVDSSDDSEVDEDETAPLTFKKNRKRKGLPRIQRQRKPLDPTSPATDSDDDSSENSLIDYRFLKIEKKK